MLNKNLFSQKINHLYLKMKKNLKNYFNLDVLLSIKKKYDCPIWIYNSNIILKKISLLKKFDVIRFAQKSCSNINILKLMLKHGVKVDAVSLGEIERALISGFNPKTDDIIFTADLFDQSVLKTVVELKLIVNIGSINMLDQLGIKSSGHKILLRINPGFGYGHSKKTNTGGKASKHGIWYEDLHLVIEKIKKYKLNLLGLHMHIGSGVNYKHLQKVCKSMTNEVIKFGQDIKIISAGGGLSIPYEENDKEVNINHYYDLWNKTRKKISNYFGHHIKLEIEPGRFLVAESGILIAQVQAIKFTDSNHKFILVDAGFNDLLRPSMYGSYHKISVIPYDNRKIDYNETVPSIVAGPLCESGDIFTQSKSGTVKPRNLPSEIKIGDYIIFHDTGAYGASMSSNYNTRTLIPEILLEKNGNYLEIRRKQTIKDLLSLEII